MKTIEALCLMLIQGVGFYFTLELSFGWKCGGLFYEVNLSRSEFEFGEMERKFEWEWE